MSSSLLVSSKIVTSTSRLRRLRAAKSKQRLWEDRAILVNAWHPVPMIPPPWWQPECEIPPDGAIEETMIHTSPSHVEDSSFIPDVSFPSQKTGEEFVSHSCADSFNTIADSLSDLNDQLCKRLYHSSSRLREVEDDNEGPFCFDGYFWLSEDLPTHYDECILDHAVIKKAKDLLTKAVVVDTQLTTEGNGREEQTYEDWQLCLKTASLKDASFDSQSGLLIEASVDAHEGPSTSLLLLVRARFTEDASDVADACLCHLKTRLPKLPVPLQYDWLFLNVVGDPTAKTLESKCHVRLLVFVRREDQDSGSDEA